MYAKFFGLQHEPFSIAPDPHYLFMSERHREALAHLLYGLRGGGGFVLLTGEIGAGKTTVCRCFLEQIPAGCNVAYIFNPKLTVTELLQTVCEEFHIEAPAGQSVKQYVDAINAHLLKTHAQGQSNVLIIDEAQNLSADVLEQLRLLTNLETHERKLLQIVLIGQPELRDMLARPELEQLAQRVIARFHLEALSVEETQQYVQHRLNVAGRTGPAPFDAKACRVIHALTRGVPRRINLLCDRALLGAYAQGQAQVTPAILKKAAAEVFAVAPERGGMSWGWPLGVAVLLGAVGVAFWFSLPKSKPPAPLPVAAVATKPVAASQPASVPKIEPTADLLSEGADEALALHELASAWHLQSAASCAELESQGVQCFRSDGGLALLRFLDRPALLVLGDGKSLPTYAVLTGLDGQTATLRLGESRQRVNLTALGQRWRGEFITLWRVPPSYQAPLTAGPAADWLGAQLAKVYGQPAPQEPQHIDTALQRRVAAFQRAQGLRADGIAGPVTLMQLGRAAGADEPRLKTE
ncbi:MAG TPA: AAA family ATPase [Burkholderiaceae bacterium]|jgi:general secretion pathway protein A